MLKVITIIKNTNNISTINKEDITVIKSIIEKGFKQDKEQLNEWEVNKLLKKLNEKEQYIAAIQILLNILKIQ